MAVFYPPKIIGKHKNCGGEVIEKIRVEPPAGSNPFQPVYGPGRRIMEGYACRQCGKDCLVEEFDFADEALDNLKKLLEPSKGVGLGENICSRCGSMMIVGISGQPVRCRSCGFQYSPFIR